MIMAISLPAQGLSILGETGTFPGPDWMDTEIVRVLIDPEINGSVVDQDFTFTVDFQNFTYNPAASTSLPGEYANGTKVPNSGHFHVYATKITGGFHQTNVFLGAPAATLLDDDTVQFNLTFPENGEYLLQVEAQYDDHTSRVPRHTQAWRAFDVAFVDVVPEPTSLALLSMGGLLLIRRRR